MKKHIALRVLVVSVSLLALPWCGHEYAYAQQNTLQIRRESPESIANRVIGEDAKWVNHISMIDLHRNVIRVNGTEDFAEIDADTGVMVRLFRPVGTGRETGPGDPKIPSEQAQQAAASFLKRVGIDTSQGWTLVRSDYLDHRGSREYLYDWRRFHFGIQLPSDIALSINADTGTVESYMLLDDPVKVPLKSRITRQAAIARVATSERYRRYFVEDARAIVTTSQDPPFPQRLVWRIVLWRRESGDTLSDRIQVDVDTSSGEIVRSARSAVQVKLSAILASMRRRKSPSVDWQRAADTKPPATVFQAALTDSRSQ